MKRNWIDIVVSKTGTLNATNIIGYKYKSIFVNFSTDLLIQGPSDFFMRRHVIMIRPNYLHKSVGQISFAIKVISVQHDMSDKTAHWHLKWTSLINISQNVKSIALPGLVNCICLKNEKEFVPFGLHIYWIHDQFEQHTYYLDREPTACENDSTLELMSDYFCLNYSNVLFNKSKDYLFFVWNVQRYHESANGTSDVEENISVKKKVGKSWIEASLLCKSFGGFLPIVTSRDELMEIISLLKLSKQIPPLEVIYLGLVGDPQESVISFNHHFLSEECGQFWNVKIKLLLIAGDIYLAEQGSSILTAVGK